MAVLAGTSLAGLAVADPSPTTDPGQDSPYTPVPNADPEVLTALGWRQFGGAVFPGANSPGYTDAGAIPHTVDFFTVSFLSPDTGFAAGSMCKDPVPAGTDEGAWLASCARVPVIYKYEHPSGDPNLAPEWHEVYRGADASQDGHGYVGAVAWIGPRKAVAVGGDGCYPRRDTPLLDGQAAEGCHGNARSAPAGGRIADRQEKIAGAAKAWLYSNGSWSPIADLPAELTGLTALDFSPRPEDCQAVRECGFAGGLGQVTMWRDGAFAPPSEPGGYRSKYVHCTQSEVDSQNNNPTGGRDCLTPRSLDNSGLPTNPGGSLGLADQPMPDSPFRIRQIKFRPGEPQVGAVSAAAVTSGCCFVDPTTKQADPTVTDPTVNYPRVVTFKAGGWTASIPVSGGVVIAHPAPRAGALPDSLYSVAFVGDGRACAGAFIFSPGGPRSSPEPASRVVGVAGTASYGCPSSLSTGLLFDSQNTFGNQVGTSDAVGRWPEVSSVRLVAGGDDVTGHALSLVDHVGGTGVRVVNGVTSPDNPDGMIDWAVGEWGSTRSSTDPTTGARGLAYTTTMKVYGLAAPYPLDCPQGQSAVPPAPGLQGPDISTGCKPNQGATTPASHHVFALPSYSLNAFTTVGVSGTSWAAGDRGALLRLSGAHDAAAGAAADEKPAKLGSGQSTRLSDRTAYDAFRPVLSAEPGLVPPLGSRPVKAVPWGLDPAGSPDPYPTVHSFAVGPVVMSSDGSEGWAMGPNLYSTGNASSLLYHYSGARWSRCEPGGIVGVLPADPACADLVELMRQGGYGAKFIAAARVPLENGSDPSRAHDFEVVAIAIYPNRKHAVVRYRDGRWQLDREWSRQLASSGLVSSNTFLQLAFGAPNDGWLVVNSDSQNPPDLYHLDSAGWTKCEGTNRERCLDGGSAPVLPTSGSDASTDGALMGGGVQGLGLTTAGTRVYLYGTRHRNEGSAGVTNPGDMFPVILSEDAAAGDHRTWTQEYDPKRNVKCGAGSATDTCGKNGFLNALTVARGSDGSLTAWGLGDFGAPVSLIPGGAPGLPGGTPTPSVAGLAPRPSNTGHMPLLHLDAGSGQWRPEDGGPAAREYLLPDTVQLETLGPSTGVSRIAALPGPNGSGPVVAIRSTTRILQPAVWLDPASGKWEPLPTPYSPTTGAHEFQQGMTVNAVPDNRGGMWVIGGPSLGSPSNWFSRFTTKVNDPVFTEVAHPIREPITATAAGGDGSFWVATESGTVYRHDRATGWDRVALKGWDAGGVVQSPAYGLAVGRDGEGLLVGQRGRIAEIGPRTVNLDPGAVLCSADQANCATTKTLRAVAVASDGSALAGGDQRTVIWRSGAGARFIAVSSPDVTKSAKITSISMPDPARAWLATDVGDVIKGTLSGDGWSWVRESTAADGTPLARDRYGTAIAVRSVAVDEHGHGYAVGDHGLILERRGEGAHPWHRIPGFGEHLHSVALGPGGRGAIIGGSAGLVLTLSNGRFEVARHSEWFDPLSASSFGNFDTGIVGVALLPGYKPGEVEAWAATQPIPYTTDAGRNPSPAGILHYASDPSDPLLAAGSGRVQPLHTDTVPHQAGEIDLAAFGKSDCRAGTPVCPELTGSKLSNELVLKGIRDALTSGPNRPDLAISTGDANDVGGSRNPDLVSNPTTTSIAHERWSELMAAPFAQAEVPLYGALGGADLSNTQHCDAAQRATCAGTHTLDQKVGTNLAWRQAFADAPAPWGTGKEMPKSQSGLSFATVGSITDGVGASAASTDGTPLAGARTHYAVDVSRDGKKLLRLVVVDTSMKTAAGTAALQNPVRDQLTWLNDVLSGREAGEMAVVVSETPSYAYSNTAGAATDTLADSAAFETVLVKNNVTAVVSGRLGWNGLYWLAAPGLHTPCPGGSYQQRPPTDASQLCQPSGNDPVSAADGVAGTLTQTSGQKVPLPSEVFQKVAGLSNIPVAIAASAGGKFGPDGRASGSGSQGFWRGYTRIRLLPPDASGKRPVPEIEQYPIFDWIGIQANEHTLAPGRKLTLNGYGREPLGIENTPNYVDINGPAITHSYDLVMADPQRPYMPLVDRTNDTATNPNHYVWVPPDLGASIDHQTGEVTYSGRGNHPPVYALAILSVGDKATSWPIVLAPRRSFSPPAPQRGPRVVIPPPPTIFSALPTPLPSPPTTPIQTPPNLNLTFPPVPPLPSLSLNSPQTTPPPPPPPPPPPVSPAASALQISPNPVGLNIAPAATVIPPPAPPIQPAPPGGARREARQRQAAAAKSEEGGDQGAGQESGNGDGGNSQASTRLDRPRDLAFTAHTDRHQPSAWSRDLLYGGGLGMAALTLALGWSLMRPGPRRRRPELPAPAYSRVPRRR